MTIMLVQAAGGFRKMTAMCKTRVPEKLTAKMEEIKDDKDAIKAYGSEFGAEMSKELMAVGVAAGSGQRGCWPRMPSNPSSLFPSWCRCSCSRSPHAI